MEPQRPSSKGLLHGSSDSISLLTRRGSASLSGSSALRGSQKLLNLSQMASGGFTVETTGCKQTSGLITSYTVYILRWKFLATGATGVVEHRYSDFLSLFQHLQRRFPNVSFPSFPEKKRFVTISDRDNVAQERLEVFKLFVKVFDGPNNDLWLDPKVQRFFDLPTELRRVQSHRNGTPTTIRKEVVQKSHQQQQQNKSRGHRRSGSEMVIVQPSRDSFASLEHSNSTLRASSKAVPALWEQDSSALGEIRRSGSDMYLSQTLLLGDESSPILSHINPSTPQTAQSQSNIHIENTPLLGRKQSVPPARVTDSGRKPSVPETTPVRTLTESRIRPATPPSLPGDISPVFARQGLEVVNVPKTMQHERIRTLKDFQFQALLGRGGFGSVFLATESGTGLVVAIKRIAKNTVIRTAKIEQIRMELAVLKQDEHYLYLAMQFCPGGDLKNFLDNVEIDEKTARLFAAEICVCVHQLHALGYVHRDLKPDNFLISQRGHLKLADFGLSVNGFQDKERRLSNVDQSQPVEEQVFTTLVVYFPPSAAEMVPGSNLDNFGVSSPGPRSGNIDRLDELVIPLEESSLDEEEDVFALKDSSGRRYRRVKIFVTERTTCNDVVDTLKLRLDIPKQIQFNLLELAFINDHVHERVVRPEELVQGLYASFDRHKFVFRRNAKSVASVVRSRAASCYSDARSINVVQPLSSSKQRLFQVLGTPNYMAREILMEQEQGYDSACDWWSVGCIIFELLYGVSPFEAPTPEGVFAKILATQTVEFPNQPEVSDDAKELICAFISPADKRLGANGGLAEVQKHDWFRGIVWGELQYSEPPFLPELENQLDIGYFPSASKANLDQYQSDSTSSSSFSKSMDKDASDKTVSEPIWQEFDWSWFT